MGDSALMAMKQLSQIVHRQAVVMGYGDAFFMLTLFYLGLSLLVMLLNKPASMTAAATRTDALRATSIVRRRTIASRDLANHGRDAFISAARRSNRGGFA